MVKIYYADETFVAACPDRVAIPETNINLGYKNGYTFLFGADPYGEIELAISPKLADTHIELGFSYMRKHGYYLKYAIEGRFFELGSETVLTIWNDISSEDMKLLKLLFRRNDPSYDISNWLFATEFDGTMAFTCTVNEFISMGLSNDWGEVDKKKLINAYNKSNKLQPATVKSTNGLGFSDRDYMRHYLYQEGKITIEDIKYMVNEVIKKMTNSEILYRGGVSKDYECLWLTTSRDYAENYGEVLTYEVPIAVLDNLACEEDAMDYLIDEEDRGADPWSTEEFYLYDRNLFDIEKMKAAGYTGYYYHEQEYKCINVCLFRDTQFKLIKQEEKPQS